MNLFVATGKLHRTVSAYMYTCDAASVARLPVGALGTRP